MIFVLQKMIWFLILPLPMALIIILIGLFLLNTRKMLGKSLILIGLMLLYALSLSSTADLILKPLESRYPPFLKNEKIAVDAVVVPGGGSTDLNWIGAAPVSNAETLSRVVKGVELAKKLGVPLILCGGNGEPFATALTDADIMAEAASALGMPRAEVIVENVSRNTLENSHAVRKLIKGDRIVLATSAYYMKRACAVFTRRGFTVIPVPVFFLSQKQTLSFNSFIPKAGDLSRSSTGIAEWVSMAWWSLRGEM